MQLSCYMLIMDKLWAVSCFPNNNSNFIKIWSQNYTPHSKNVSHTKVSSKDMLIKQDNLKQNCYIFRSLILIITTFWENYILFSQNCISRRATIHAWCMETRKSSLRHLTATRDHTFRKWDDLTFLVPQLVFTPLHP